MRRRMSALFVTACLFAGCETKPSVDFSPFHGVYHIDSHTLNPSSCDAEGDAVAGSKPLLVLFSFVALNVGKVALADSCTDLAACQERAANPGPSIGTAADFEGEFSSVTTDGQGLTGTSFGLETNGQIAHVCDNVLTRNAGSIRIEMRTRVVPCQTSAGTCDKAATIAASASAPCTELRAVAATYQAGL